jgi:alkylation response protein AidB-like acyl-CoA dehydrogenase
VQDVIGGPGDGWGLLNEVLGHERRAMGAGLGDNSRRPELDARAGDVADREGSGRRRGGLAAGGGAEELLRTLLPGASAPLRDEAMRLYSLLRIAPHMDAHASVRRLVTAEIARRQRDLYLELQGAAGMLTGNDAPLGGVVQRLALWSPAMSIMLGTDEVQRNIVGERVLGLPAEPSADRGVAWRDIRRS